MGLWNFISKIGKGAFNTGVQSIDFVTDIAQEALPGRDEYEGSGIADTIWGSFNDNILGEGGVMQSAIGPEGVGGTIIGAIPESARKPMKNVIDPTFKAVQVAYKQTIDRGFGTAMTMASIADSSGEVTTTTSILKAGFPTGLTLTLGAKPTKYPTRSPLVKPCHWLWVPRTFLTTKK